MATSEVTAFLVLDKSTEVSKFAKSQTKYNHDAKVFILIPKSIRPTLLIQKWILLFNTSTGIPIAAARFLELQLKTEI
jgi:hypothetical protein